MDFPDSRASYALYQDGLNLLTLTPRPYIAIADRPNCQVLASWATFPDLKTPVFSNSQEAASIGKWPPSGEHVRLSPWAVHCVHPVWPGRALPRWTVWLLLCLAPLLHVGVLLLDGSGGHLPVPEAGKGVHWYGSSSLELCQDQYGCCLA